MTKLEALKKIRSLLAKPEHWLQQCDAHDSAGFAVAARDTTAHKFCLQGAVRRITDQYYGEDYHDVRVELINALPPKHRYLTLYNDAPTRRHSQILALIDRAIENVRKAKKVKR